MKRLAVLFGLSLVALGLLGASSAATRPPLAGDLDPTFGNNGVVNSPAGAIAVQPDGKIVVLSSGSVVRYRPDGSLDSSFGSGGSAAIAFGPAAVELQPDGKIVVAGTAYTGRGDVTSEFAVARYNPDGSPDTSFGTNGTTETVIPVQPDPNCPGQSWSRANALAILPSGDILAAGTVWQFGCDIAPASRFALAQYTPSGSLDSTFGDNGIVQTDFSIQYGLNGVESDLAGVAVQPDGKIVASGGSGYGGHGDYVQEMALTRYNPDGSVDNNFGLRLTDPKAHYEVGLGPPILEQGKILVPGTRCRPNCATRTGTHVPVLAHYDANGAGVGITSIGDGVLPFPRAVVAQSDGKVLVAETDGSPPQDTATVARLLPSGRLDGSFGRGGLVPFGNDVSALALQADGKILVGGATLSRLIGRNNCFVPPVRGKTVLKASATLQQAYCSRGLVSKRFSSKVARGRVISTKPSDGTRLPGGSKVGFVVSKGKRS